MFGRVCFLPPDANLFYMVWTAQATNNWQDLYERGREAKRGDVVASEIVERAARELALSARVVIEKLGMEDDVFDLILAGGIFKGSTKMVEVIRDEVRKYAPQADVKTPILEPVVGAGLIALGQIASSDTDG